MQEDLLVQQRGGAEAAAEGRRDRQQEPAAVHQVALQRQGEEVKRREGEFLLLQSDLGSVTLDCVNQGAIFHQP